MPESGRRVTDQPLDPFDELVQAIAWELYLDGVHRRTGPTPVERSARIYLMARQRRMWDIPALCKGLGVCPAVPQSADDNWPQPEQGSPDFVPVEA